MKIRPFLKSELRYDFTKKIGFLTPGGDGWCHGFKHFELMTPQSKTSFSVKVRIISKKSRLTSPYQQTKLPNGTIYEKILREIDIGNFRVKKVANYTTLRVLSVRFYVKSNLTALEL